MEANFPKNVSIFLDFLEKQQGFSLEDQQESEGFGDIFLILRKESFLIRLVHDRGIWFIEIASNEQPNEWYDIILVKEHFTTRIEKDMLEFNEQCEFLKANFPLIMSSIKNRDFFSDLENWRLERAKRLFPDWYKDK